MVFTATNTLWWLQEPLLDKLRALDYETQFCATCVGHCASIPYNAHPGMPFHPCPASTLPFPNPTPPSPFAFSHWCALWKTPPDGPHPHQASWLLNAAGRESDKPLNAANPANAVDTLLLEAKALGLYTPPLERLREHLEQGVGAGATAVLNTLCDVALERRGFQWRAVQRTPAAGWVTIVRVSVCCE